MMTTGVPCSRAIVWSCLVVMANQFKWKQGLFRRFSRAGTSQKMQDAFVSFFCMCSMEGLRLWNHATGDRGAGMVGALAILCRQALEPTPIFLLRRTGTL